MKKTFFTCVLATLCSSLFADEVVNAPVLQKEITFSDEKAESIIDQVDLSKPEGRKAFFFYTNASAFFASIQSMRVFPEAERLALSASWAPYFIETFDDKEALAALLPVALGVDHPYGASRDLTREGQLELLKKYGDIHDVANQVAWFLLTSSNDQADHQQALDILKTRTDLDHASYDTLGYAYYKLGHYDDALQSYFTSREMLHRDDPLAFLKLYGILYHMGETLLAKGDQKEATIAWNAVVHGIEEFSKKSGIDIKIASIIINVDYPRLVKSVKALRVLLKKEETRKAAQGQND